MKKLMQVFHDSSFLGGAEWRTMTVVHHSSFIVHLSSFRRVGWALASPSGCNPPAYAVQVQLLPDTPGRVRLLARSPVFQAGQMGSKPIRANKFSVFSFQCSAATEN